MQVIIILIIQNSKNDSYAQQVALNNISEATGPAEKLDCVFRLKKKKKTENMTLSKQNTKNNKKI
ncbi:hypothetical protein HpBGD133_16280 [Helicobacter pylori]